MKITVFLAEGFEETEAVTVIDLLRRAGINTVTSAIGENILVTGAHGISIKADELFNEKSAMESGGVVLPGGMPGTLNLQRHEGVLRVINKMYNEGKLLCAICAAPKILGEEGLLSGKKACCYPGLEGTLFMAKTIYEPVADAENIITSRALGTAIPFGLKIIEKVKGEKASNEIRKSIVF